MHMQLELPVKNVEVLVFKMLRFTPSVLLTLSHIGGYASEYSQYESFEIRE